MSKFKFFPFGGIGEIGQNMYVLEINDKIFVLDCGSSQPLAAVSGYDFAVPNYDYLLNNIGRVKGVFITHFSQKSSGGFSRVTRDLKVPYYGSEFTIQAIKERLLPNMADDYKEGITLNVVNTDEEIVFDDVRVEFFSLTSSAPDTFGIAIKINVAEDGQEPVYKSIVYLPDFDFDMNYKGHFKTDFKTLNKISDDGILLLLSPSTGAPKLGHVTTDGKLDIMLHKIVSHEGRLFVVMDAENVSGMLEVIKASAYQKRRVTIIGNKARTLVELAMKLGYTDKYEDYYMPKQVLNDEKRNSANSVIIIAGEQTEEFHKIGEISMFTDKHYLLNQNDNVIFLVDTPKKYEKILADVWNNILFINATLLDFDINLMPTPVCGSEDLKLLYSLLSPEYIIPISGDYRMIKAQANLVKEYGFTQDQIIEMDVEDVATFENGKFVSVEKSEQAKNRKDYLFSVDTDSDINDLVAGERDALTREGFIIVSGMINLRERETYGKVDIITSGFLPEYGQEDEFEKLKAEFLDIVNTHLRLKKVDFKELRLEIKNSLSKIIFKDTRKKPVLIPVIIDVSIQQQNQQQDK